MDLFKVGNLVLFKLLSHITDVSQGKTKLGVMRSNHWPTLRKQHLEQFPACAVCGGTKKLQVHHLVAFHLDPKLELDPSNLITLCEDGTNCHLNYGHAGDFKGLNPSCAKDAKEWKAKFEKSIEIAKSGKI